MPERVVANGPITVDQRGRMVVHNRMPARGMIDLLGFAPDGAPIVLDIKTVAAPTYGGVPLDVHVSRLSRDRGWVQSMALYVRLLLGWDNCTRAQVERVHVVMLVIVKDPVAPRAQVLPLVSDPYTLVCAVEDVRAQWGRMLDVREAQKSGRMLPDAAFSPWPDSLA